MRHNHLDHIDQLKNLLPFIQNDICLAADKPFECCMINKNGDDDDDEIDDDADDVDVGEINQCQHNGS